MKKGLLIFAALFTFGYAANAQDQKSSGDGMVKFGAKAGLNLSTLVGDVSNVDMKVGFHVGGVAEIKLMEKFAIQPELLLSTQGAKSEMTFADEFGSWKEEDNLSLTYLNLPVMAKYYVIEGLSVEAGPQIGFLLSAKAKNEASGTDFDGTSWSESTDTDVKKFYNGVDFGFNIGAGYQLPMGLFFQGRYNIGLSDVSKKQDNDIVDVKATNAVFQLSVGYKF